MHLTWFQWINVALLLILFMLAAQYLYVTFLLDIFQPPRWREAKMNQQVGKRLRKVQRQYRDKVRFFTWWMQVDRINREGLEGAFAELGVYKGESAKVLHAMDPKRRFYLFDTFQGFQTTDLAVETGEAATYTSEHFSDTTLDKVKHFIGGNEQVVFMVGDFNETCSSVEKEKFVLVNLDADLYIPTKAALTFFYPRMVPGGVICIHDYTSKWEGLQRAVDEFIATIDESPVLVPDLDGTILLVKNKKK